MRDNDADGYCSAAAGEVNVIYSTATTTGSTLTDITGLAIREDGFLIASDVNSNNMHRLSDSGIDGDANDAGEQPFFFISDSTGVILGDSESIAFAPGGAVVVMYVNPSSPTDSIFRLRDNNGNGFMSNPAEVNTFWGSA